MFFCLSPWMISVLSSRSFCAFGIYLVLDWTCCDGSAGVRPEPGQEPGTAVRYVSAGPVRGSLCSLLCTSGWGGGKDGKGAYICPLTKMSSYICGGKTRNIRTRGKKVPNSTQILPIGSLWNSTRLTHKTYIIFLWWRLLIAVFLVALGKLP